MSSETEIKITLDHLHTEVMEQKKQICQLNRDLLFSSSQMELNELKKDLDKQGEEIDNLKTKLREAEENMEKSQKRQFLLESLISLSSKKPLALLSESDEDVFFQEARDLNLSMTTGEIVYRLRSKYTVTKDCGVDCVGWDFDIDDFTLFDDHRKIIDTDGIQMSFLLKQIQERVDEDDVEPQGRVNYDGDHHGVWAYGKTSWEVVFYKLGDGENLEKDQTQDHLDKSEDD